MAEACSNRFGRVEAGGELPSNCNGLRPARGLRGRTARRGVSARTEDSSPHASSSAGGRAGTEVAGEAPPMIRENVIRVLPPNLLVSHYLTASYCYYHLNLSPMTDEAFDLMCVRLKKHYKELTHRHWRLVEYDSLTAGTCLLRMDQFPQIVQMSADMYLDKAHNGEMEADLLSRFGGAPAPRARRTRPSVPVEETKPATTRIKRVRPTPAPAPEPPKATAPRIRRVRPSVR